ncbi:hypothetical protein Fot_24348 [Forsythia ovata]|uniref:Uncharacterized protein n=1 Tax=Forsythia ovata TaxID=205694 RepID=A0ABD1U5Y3_9LAMI
MAQDFCGNILKGVATTNTSTAARESEIDTFELTLTSLPDFSGASVSTSPEPLLPHQKPRLRRSSHFPLKLNAFFIVRLVTNYPPNQERLDGEDPRPKWERLDAEEPSVRWERIDIEKSLIPCGRGLMRRSLVPCERGLMRRSLVPCERDLLQKSQVPNRRGLT